VLAFYGMFYTENWVKNKENPLFSLKREYLRITKKYRSQCRKVLETWNLAKLGTKVIQKEILGHFFYFRVFRPDSQVFRPKNRIFPNFRPKTRESGWKIRKSKKWPHISFCITFVPNLAKFQVSSTFLHWDLYFLVILRYSRFSKNKGFSLFLAQFSV